MQQKIKAVVFDAYGTLYDVQSVEQAVEVAFPGYGSLITAIWRIKQLEYTWLTSLMGRYEDFWDLTKRALDYTLRSLHLEADAGRVEQIAAAYLSLRPYDDARNCLDRLAPQKLAILSNGSPAMLSDLVKNSSFDRFFDRILSVDRKRVFKPAADAYALVGEELGVTPDEVVFVSSNGFDICGAKNFGFTVVRVARSTDRALDDLPLKVDERALFDLLRGQAETLDHSADVTVRSLAEIPKLFGDQGRSV
ncbi:haloacid dehalogenase type II [Rhizobium calliandrae]|uniref:(S)-2-haloacid dehalogenase n=1 Tax=Rhizobium calliandrae TaxID=1312182 RepID=A0ABT7KMD8_9HYPH|nr:haloacid dehalogenase type II [Rhizobium calliandrae]MDL2409098.1 haloacid dehalogenase type II [Rhizobium calliandrae]